MRVFGIDPGSRLGWGCIEDGKLLACGICRKGSPGPADHVWKKLYRLPSGKWKKQRVGRDTTRFVLMARQAKEVSALIQQYDPDIIGIEATPPVHFRERPTNERHRAVMFQYHATACTTAVLCAPRPTSLVIFVSAWDWKPGHTVRKLRWTQSKEETIAKVNALYDCGLVKESVKDCDIADGVGIAHAIYTTAMVGKRTAMDLVSWLQAEFTEARVWSPQME